MHQERAEECDRSGADFERDQPRRVVTFGIHLEAAEAVDIAALLQALAMAPGLKQRLMSVLSSLAGNDSPFLREPCYSRLRMRFPRR
jgi:hypothetical protein